MLGTFVNTATIIIGSIIGHIAKKAIRSTEWQQVMFTAMGLAATALGFNAVSNNLPKSQYPVLFIISLAVGGLIGTILAIDEKFNKLVLHFSKSNLSQGLSIGILLYCVGALSIVGPVMSALHGDNTYLFTNATLDLVTSAVLATIYGIGMIAAAPILFLWQTSIYLFSLSAGNIISEELLTETSIVGGILIAASGFGILKIKDCKTLNLLPALAVPPIFFAIKNLFNCI